MAKHYYTVWGVNFENDNRAVVSLSRSRRVKEGSSYDKALEDAGGARNGYITDFRDSYVNFVGKAVSQLKKYGIQERDRIYADIEISNEPYVKNGQIEYMKGFKHTVYEFDLPGSSQDDTKPAQTPKNIDRAPRVAEDEPYNTEPDIDDEENPF